MEAWISERNAALKDGDTAGVEALSAPNCRSCDELTTVIRDVYDAGGSFSTEGWSVAGIEEKAGAEPVQVDTALVFAAGETIASPGADPVEYAQEKHIVTFRLTKLDGSYVVQLILFRS